MDSKIVTRAIKEEIYPFLRELGFSSFKGRKAWRFRDACIDAIAIDSFNSYLAESIGVTTFSFSAGVGVYYKAVHSVPWARDPLPSVPDEWRCHARRSLRKSVFQLFCRRPDVWYVNRRGSNLAELVRDLRLGLENQALAWLEELGDLQRALIAFETRDESEMKRGILLETLGGGLASFARAEVCSALALALGERERAAQAWQRVVKNPYYARIPEMFQQAKERLLVVEGLQDCA